MIGPTITDSILFTVLMVWLYALILVPVWWVWWRD